MQVVGKNAELEKQITTSRKVKLFKTDLLQLTADELNYTLCLFVKEVRKPNGAEYAPDTIYYLCLGKIYLNANTISVSTISIVQLQEFNNTCSRTTE